jgi:hypothetical protein
MKIEFKKLNTFIGYISILFTYFSTAVEKVVNNLKNALVFYVIFFKNFLFSAMKLYILNC